MFLILDVIHTMQAWCKHKESFVVCEQQVNLMVFTALSQGFALALLFALIQVESRELLIAAFLEQQSLAYPIGVLLSCSASMLNDWSSVSFL
jgi:hypothetical protein